MKVIKVSNLIIWGLLFLIASLILTSCNGTGESWMAHKKDIVQTAAGAGDFNTLLTALEKANLKNTLQQEGPYTVFAPTDQAFAKLPGDTLNDLLKPENNAKLKNILLYHVVSGKLKASEVIRMHSITALNNADLNVNKINGDVMINESKVIKANIKCSNGIIHVIDTVLVPR